MYLNKTGRKQCCETTPGICGVQECLGLGWVVLLVFAGLAHGLAVRHSGWTPAERLCPVLQKVSSPKSSFASVQMAKASHTDLSSESLRQDIST